jgi:hypothetical protein
MWEKLEPLQMSPEKKMGFLENALTLVIMFV